MLKTGKASYDDSVPTNLWDICVMLRRVTSIITGLPFSFVSDALNKILVKITYIQMSHLQIRSGKKKKKQSKQVV